MDTKKKLKAIFEELLVEIGNNEGLRSRIEAILQGEPKGITKQAARPHRRNPGPFDPMAVYREQPESLLALLEPLGLEELKDIIAEHGMDRGKLSMKWKNKDRLIELIMDTVKTRARKGDAFRGEQVLL